MKNIVIVAGDTSGDLYGGFLAKKIKEKYEHCQVYSFGGKNLAKNSSQIIDLVSDSVCGLIEVLASLSKLKKLFSQTLNAIEKINPDLIILIDFPDFNLRLAKKINRRYPVFYYVSPQVWAWRKKRTEIIKKFTEKIIPIFNFEVDFYRENNISALYFGHPLLEIINQQKPKKENIISLLPGSRKNEIKHHIKLLAKTKEIIQEKLPNYSFQVLKPKGINNRLYEKFFSQNEIINHSYQVLAKSSFVITASGTATVETAILEIPHLIIYKVNKLTWIILKKTIKIKFAGMINLLAGKLLVPELLQSKANSRNIAETTLGYLQNDEAYSNFQKKLKQAKEMLAPQNGITKFAEYISQYLKQKN